MFTKLNGVTFQITVILNQTVRCKHMSSNTTMY